MWHSCLQVQEHEYANGVTPDTCGIVVCRYGSMKMPTESPHKVGNAGHDLRDTTVKWFGQGAGAYMA